MGKGHAEGFTYEVRGDEVVVYHHGRKARTLRGRTTADFLAAIEAAGADDAGGQQEVMARVTGNYKRGNERVARKHPRNQSRR